MPAYGRLLISSGLLICSLWPGRLKNDKDHTPAHSEADQQPAEHQNQHAQKKANLLDKVDEINSRKKNEIPGKKLEEKMKDK